MSGDGREMPLAIDVGNTNIAMGIFGEWLIVQLGGRRERLRGGAVRHVG